jgi:hypothetical protein
MINYITEELLLEILKEPIPYHRNHEFEKELNRGLKGKIYPAHTNVMYTDYMKNHGHAVIKLMNHKKQVEYHIHNDNLEPGQRKNKEHIDTKSSMHMMNIIKHDSDRHMKLGHKIKIQSANETQHKLYGKLINHLIKGRKDKKVIDAGKTERLDGTGTSYTHIIEDDGYGAVNWNEFRRKLREQENT